VKKKQLKKERQRALKAARHVALAERVETDRALSAPADSEPGTMAIAVPREVDAAVAGLPIS
jgi:hypothetical protein